MENVKKIEWDGEKEITELIYQLSKLLEEGYKTVKFETYETGTGSNEDGSYEYPYWDARLISDY